MRLGLPISKEPKRTDDLAARLRLSPLFDAKFYLAALAGRGMALRGRDPAEHYLAEGEAARIPPSLLFDPGYYAERNPDVAQAGISPLHHYLDNGCVEGRDPHPLVDLKLLRSQLAADFAGDPLVAYLQSRGGQLQPHALVDPAFLEAQQRRLNPRDDRPALVFYLESDPEAVNPSAEFDGLGYRKLYPKSATLNPLLHYARHGQARGLRPPRDRGPLGRAAAEIEAAALLDPDILKPFAQIAATPFLHGYDMARREFRLYRLLAKAVGRRPHAHVILTPWLKRGGADRAVLHLARALLENDPDDPRLNRLHAGRRDRRARLGARLRPPQRRARVAREIDDKHDTFVAFCNFLRFAGCAHLYVVNSRFGWDLVEKYGPVLRGLMRLYGFAFCQDYDPAGRRAGYAWTHLGNAIDHLHALVSDNSRTIREFAADHALDADDLAKFACLPLPVDERLFDAAAQVQRNLGGAMRRRVFWAGRFGAQKGLDIAAEVAKALPGVDFCAYGGSEAPPPLTAGGPFDDFADLPLHEASLFLHTARWEGLPNVLLEAGAAGLPIVARDVGGVGDLLDASTGWLVPASAGAPEIARAVREALDRPEEALARARAMRARIAERHSWAAFKPAVARLTGGARG